MHLLDLAGEIKQSVQSAGLVGYRFNTIGVSDGISMGTNGMSFSLQSREIIADSIETVMSAQWYDANVSIPGCDKNMPGCVMGVLREGLRSISSLASPERQSYSGSLKVCRSWECEFCIDCSTFWSPSTAMARVNRPSIMVYGGTIRAGCGAKKQPLDIVSAFQAYGEFIAGRINENERFDIIRHACPGAGACGGMSPERNRGRGMPGNGSGEKQGPRHVEEWVRSETGAEACRGMGLEMGFCCP